MTQENEKNTEKLNIGLRLMWIGVKAVAEFTINDNPFLEVESTKLYLIHRC